MDRTLTGPIAPQKEFLSKPNDACVGVRLPDGELRLHQTTRLAQTGALAGGTSSALWGTPIGLLFRNPLAGRSIGASGERGTRRQGQRLRHL